MSDRELLERRLAQAEELLNLFDAMRPDLPAADLYELALQTLLGIDGYTAGSLWTYHGAHYRSAAWDGLDRRRAARLRRATIDAPAFQQFIGQLESSNGMHWSGRPLPPATPEPLQTTAEAGHTLIVPLAYMNQVGFAALESAEPRPDDETTAALARFGDKIAVALDTARLFQEHLATIEELRRLTNEQRRLQETVFELSAPLLPLLPGVLVLPLIGTIDTARADRILAAELDAIIKERAEVVLVDITGTDVIDAGVAIQLVRSADAAQLLGCRTILVGVQPRIAQTLVELRVNLRGITTRSTLADGLRDALRLVRWRLVALDSP